MTSLEKIAFLFSYGIEAIRTFIVTEELVAEMTITFLFLGILIAVL